MKKLTLTAEPEIIEMAKKLARERGTSVSAMFSQVIAAMGGRGSGRKEKVGLITQRLTGIAKSPRGATDRELLEEALVRRYAR